MKKVLLISFLSLVVILWRCGEYDQPETALSQDSVEHLVAVYDSLSNAVREASEILDKIDLKRGNTTTLMQKNKPITARLDELKEYIRISEERIDKLEKDLKSARLESTAYSMMADAFRNEVEVGTRAGVTYDSLIIPAKLRDF